MLTQTSITEPCAVFQDSAERQNVAAPLKSKAFSGKELSRWVEEAGLQPLTAPPQGLSVKTDEGLAQVLAQVDGSKKRMIWLVNGCTRLDHLKAIMAAVSPCSRVINVLRPDQPNLQVMPGTVSSLGVLTEDRFILVTAGAPSDQVLQVNAFIDVDQYLGWKPVLVPTSLPEAISHLQVFYRELTAYLNQKAVTRMTKIGSSHLFLANALVNAVFANKINDIEIYKDIHKDKPALIVATGPSLNKQLETLGKFKDLFLIIAVDPAVPILKERGIIPHFVLSIDPKKRPYWKHNELDDKTTFVIDIGCCPDVAWSNNKKYLVTSCHSEVHRLMAQLGAHASRLMTGGSVATNALNLAVHMGASPIVMIGQDLAWTDGKDHADGYVSQYSREVLEARREKGFEITGYDGKPVRTERQLLYYKTWFEMRAKQIPDTKIINSTEGGARIDGVAHIPFLNVCNELKNSSEDKSFNDVAAPWKLDLEYVSDYKKNIDDLLERIRSLQNKITKVITLLEKSNEKPKKSLLRKIDDLNSLLKNGDHDVKLTVEMFGQAVVAAAEHRLFRDGLSENISSVTRAYLDIYRAAKQGCDSSIIYISKISRLLHDIKKYQTLSIDMIYTNELNRWMKSGDRNTSAL